MSGTTLGGPLPTKLANEISDAINAAMNRGMEADEAVSVALGVLADYGRTYYGDEYLLQLSHLCLDFAERPIGGTDISVRT